VVNNSQLHRERLRPWIIGVVVVTCVLAAVAAVRPENASVLWPLTGFVGLIAGSLLLPSYLRARRLDHGLSALLADPWVHWRYPEDQWVAWKAAEAGRLDAASQAFDPVKATVPFGLFLVAMWVVIGLSAGTDDEKLTTIAIATVPLTAGFGVVLWSVPGRLRAQRERVAAAPPEALVGAAGIFCEGEFSPLAEWEYHLTSAAISDNPQHRLLLQFRKRDGKSWTDVIRSIPIPEGAAADLARLQGQLREKCPKAAIRIVPEEGGCG
jgi:hypothetical protein